MRGGGPGDGTAGEGTPRFVDEHRLRIAAPRDHVWTALRRYVEGSLTRHRTGPLLRLLGTEPPSGFALSGQVPGSRLELTGRHRFSRYRLVFELADAGNGTTELTGRTFADFPGVSGRAYRALVIGSRAHVLAVRRMLHSIRRACLG